ncbi:hypothetical protein FIU97_02185 [Roseivivax sp. THAF40]|uniref:hypothetical protein n=1 Tax=Roseivivax sp. THAF40 TaxID=2587858 RepID=UPI0012681BA1|nr:hypothetical protein [Roseivivax sp. THAF40]QFT45374.1 hypothetical protein FIU97_02185 [Roseivivax sp. THAF40]
MKREINKELVQRVLSGELSTEVLNDAEAELWLDLFVEKMGKPGKDEEAFFAARRERCRDLDRRERNE